MTYLHTTAVTNVDLTKLTFTNQFTKLNFVSVNTRGAYCYGCGYCDDDGYGYGYGNNYNFLIIRKKKKKTQNHTNTKPNQKQKKKKKKKKSKTNQKTPHYNAFV